MSKTKKVTRARKARDRAQQVQENERQARIMAEGLANHIRKKNEVIEKNWSCILDIFNEELQREDIIRAIAEGPVKIETDLDYLRIAKQSQPRFYALENAAPLTESYSIHTAHRLTTAYIHDAVNWRARFVVKLGQHQINYAMTQEALEAMPKRYLVEMLAKEFAKHLKLTKPAN